MRGRAALRSARNGGATAHPHDRHRRQGRGALDLTFSSVPEPLAATLTGGVVIDPVDGCGHNVNVDGAPPELTSLIATAFRTLLSVSEIPESRHRSNKNKAAKLRKLLKFISALPACEQVLGARLMVEYRKYLYKNFAATTAHGEYGAACQAMEALFRMNKVARFPLPRNESKAVVRGSAVSAGRTFATTFVGANFANANEANETLMGGLLDLFWSEIEALFERLERGRNWRMEVRDGCPPPTLMMSDGRDRLTEASVKALEAQYGGFDSRNPYDTRRSETDCPWRHLQVTAYQRARPQGGITRIALLTFFHPTVVLASLFAGILAAGCVNPASIECLELDDMQPDAQDPALRRIVPAKARALGDVDLPPFPVGGRNARTLPRLWERYVVASEEIRRLAPPSYATRLLLWCPRQIAPPPAIGAFTWPGAINECWQVLRKYLAGQYHVRPSVALNPEYDIIRQNLDVLTLSLIRDTAINVASARLNRDFAKTALAVGHRSTSSLELSYLNNPQVREDLETEVRRVQRAMHDWVHRPIAILPPDPDTVARELGLAREEAVKVVADERNLGYGVSLVNERTVIIDTPLNALRMMQWLEHLKKAEHRMLNDNPERWEQIYRDQVHVFTQALADFPRRTLKAAKAMNEDIRLPFPMVT